MVSLSELSDHSDSMGIMAVRSDQFIEILYYVEGLPLYRGGHAPDELATRRQLRAAGLSEAGLKPAGWLHYSALHGICPLYERAHARPIRPLTSRQRDALAAGRERAGTMMCRECRAVRLWPELTGSAYCVPCGEILRERAWERELAARQKFSARLERDRREAAQWAREVLADPEAVILDTETTSLGGYVMEIAVIRVVDGAVLLDTRVNPGVPVDDGAYEVHGISDDDVRNSPRFCEIRAKLLDILAGRRVVIYNVAFDSGVLVRELERYHQTHAPFHIARWTWRSKWDGPHADTDDADVAAWSGSIRWECAMEAYAAWWGEWSDYWGSYTWQKLNGGHDARGDCEAVRRRLRVMADSLAAETSDSSDSAKLALET
jgi:hypothetical protein